MSMTKLRERLWILLTDALHFALGAIAVVFDIAIPVSILYILYQSVDYNTCDNAGYICAEEIKRDITEFVAGLVVGALIKLFFA